MDCDEKLAFDNREDAEKATVVANYQHGVNLKVYLCRACGLWHLTSDYEE